MTIDETLQTLLSEVFKRAVGASEDVVRAEEPGWDSLVHMELIFMVEDEFGVEFTPEDIASLASRSQIAARVQALQS